MTYRSTSLVTVVLLVVALGGCGSTTDEAGDDLAGGGAETVPVPHRLVADDLPIGEPWTTGVAVTGEELDARVTGAGLGRELDWAREVALVFTLAESSSCPFGAFEDLVMERGELVVHPDVGPEPEGDCTADANPHTVVVAVEREALPDGGFSLWVDGDDPPPGVVDGVTHVAAGELAGAVDADPPALGADGELAVGEVRIARDVTTHCGVARLFRPVDGRQWVLTGAVPDELDHVPPEWREHTDGEAIDLRIERIAADELVVTPVGVDAPRTYAPAPDQLGCD